MALMSKITNLIAHQLQDITGVTWDDEDVLLPYCNLGIKEIINLIPEAYTITRILNLVPGSVQSFGSSGTVLTSVMEYVCNMGTTGTTVGSAVTSVKKSVIDSVLPGWMTMDADDDVIQVVVDDRTPKIFYTIPPQPDTPGSLKAVLFSIPEDVTATTDTFPLDDIYIPATVNYGVYRALSEETTIPNALAKAATFKDAFLESLGIKKSVDKEEEAKGK